MDSVSEVEESKQRALMPPAQDIKPVVGIGVSLRADEGNIIIQEIIPDSPAAAQKDIHAGDRIIAIAQADGPSTDAKRHETHHGGRVNPRSSRHNSSADNCLPGEDATHARTLSIVRAELKLPLH